ncbi:MAG: HNH endonuclease [Opitutae bacterium]|nr:HNH endonuclease [Opitutae bacterium]
MSVKKISNDVLGMLQGILDAGISRANREIKWNEDQIKRIRVAKCGGIREHQKEIREAKQSLLDLPIKFERDKEIFLSGRTDVKPKCCDGTGVFKDEKETKKDRKRSFRTIYYSEVYILQNIAYVVVGLYSEEEKSLLVQAEHDKERSKFERLKRKFELAQNLEEKPKRRPIPEEVRVAVWRRDQGTCVKCGSRERLEYDHIIPVAEGGGDSVRNIELLCEKCNRSKGAKIQ